MIRILMLASLLLLAACRQDGEPETTEPAQDPVAVPQADQTEQPEAGLSRLEAVLAAQPDEIRARYDARHPRETMEFFGIEPGMTVVEVLPGGGWYTRILLPYLGSRGHLIAANYPLEMWPLFPFATEEFMVETRKWPEQFPEQARGWCESDCARVSTFWLGDLPEDLAGTADAVLFIRALHNLARFQDEGGYLEAALTDAFAALKPGGLLGIVQHWARDDMPDDWADGSNGYLKKQYVMDHARAVGFEFVAESAINTNPKDQPATDEYVWRLPPSLSVPEDDAALRAKYLEIGESHRMTLKFRKPE